MSTTLFKTIMRALAAVLTPIAALVVNAFLGVFQGPAPTDISTGLWVVLSGVLVFVLNFVLGKIGAQRTS